MALLKVKTESGWVEGQPSANQLNSLFKGIPYAAPPAGELRWKAPQPVIPWEGIRDCSKWPNICPQVRFPSEGGGIAGQEFYVLEPTMSEDCLYLNIWTPAKRGDEALPVAIYIHGGNLVTGYGYLNAYDGDGFNKRGVILVTINYRLNIFAMMSHPELRAEDPNRSTGAYGFMDQAAAIKWVKRNIAAFGGDPECITIFGQSGGSLSVQAMITNPNVKGDFKRAIMQSAGGVPTGTNANTPTVEDCYGFFDEFLKHCNVSTIREARAIPTMELLDKYLEFFDNYPDQTKARRCMRQKVDGYILTGDTSKVMLNGEFPEIDYMVGSTSQEGYMKVPRVPPLEKLKRDARVAYLDAAEKYLAVIRPEDTEYTKQFFHDFMGDDMTSAAIAWSELQVMLNRKPAYHYYFTLIPPGAETAHHSAEHHYVFQTLTRSNRPYTGRDYDLSNELADRWANFIKTGDPNGEGYTVWKPFTKDAPEALIIDRERRMGKVPETPKITFMKDHALGRIK